MSRRLGRGFPSQPLLIVGAEPAAAGEVTLNGVSAGASTTVGAMASTTILLDGVSAGSSTTVGDAIGSTLTLAGTSAGTSVSLAFLSGGSAIVSVTVREKPPLRQHIEIITTSDRYYRWGEDEPLPENVFSDLRHSSTMPGGFESCDVTLPRQPGVDYSDLERLSTLRVIGAGGQVDGEYRLERAPRASGDRIAVSPSAQGWQAHLDDDRSAREIYRDTDLTAWQGPSVQRRINTDPTTDLTESSVVPDDTTGAPSLVSSLVGAWARQSQSEAWYGFGIPLGSVWYAWKRGGMVNQLDTNWTWSVRLSTTDTLTASDDSGNLRAAGPSSGTVVSTAGNREFAAVRLNYAVAAGTEGSPHNLYWTGLVVYGQHGLTLRGAEPDAGFYASDIVAHAVRTWAPLLTIKTDSIQTSSFVIPHLAFVEPTTAAEIVRQASRFNLPDWAVWDDKEFVWHARGARGKKWRARIGPSNLEETGPQVERVWNSIIVQYQDVDGSSRTVGPPDSGADTEDATLVDSDPENPANQLGIIRRDILTMGVSTAAGAIVIGEQFLEMTRLLDTSGRATIVGWVEDDRGVTYPYSRIRAGDYIAFVDASDSSYRRIVRADHDRASRSCSIDLDSPPEGLQVLLERFGVGIRSLGFS